MVNKQDQKAIAVAALLLAGFAFLGISLIAFTNEATKERIAKQKYQALLAGLNDIIPSDRYDNDIAVDAITVQDKNLLGGEAPRTAYRARKAQQPVAVVISTATAEGYDSTPIEILVGINVNGSLAGVRVVYHKETPGLGDKITLDRSPWVLSFNTKSLHSHSEPQWNVKKDGGDFDQFTGATITPRAVVRAVHKVLLYYKRHRDSIFALTTEASHDE